MPHNISFFCQLSQKRLVIYMNFFEMQHMVKPIKNLKVIFICIMNIMTLFMYKIIFNTSGDAIKPYINTVKGIQDLLRWQNSAYTLIVFMVRTSVITLL